ncbi:hypothetical protein FB645_000375 [Coemansia sp. IMI 203386]|nr:hypothetical protein FB645_000375 [Coemansia sp. IMI 203386]
MKLSFLPMILAAGAALTSAHYECTTDQAFDVLFNNATADALAQRILVSLEKGVVELRDEISHVDAQKAATTIVDYYRYLVSHLPKNVVAKLPPV